MILITDESDVYIEKVSTLRNIDNVDKVLPRIGLQTFHIQILTWFCLPRRRRRRRHRQQRQQVRQSLPLTTERKHEMFDAEGKMGKNFR